MRFVGSHDSTALAPLRSEGDQGHPMAQGLSASFDHGVIAAADPLDFSFTDAYLGVGGLPGR